MRLLPLLLLSLSLAHAADPKLTLKVYRTDEEVKAEQKARELRDKLQSLQPETIHADAPQPSPPQPEPIPNPAPPEAPESFKKQLAQKFRVSESMIEKVASWKAWPKLIELVKHPQFATDAESVIHHPNRAYWLWAQGGWLVLCLFVSVWRRSKARGFFGRFFVGVFVFAAYVAGAILLVPFALFGMPFYRLVRGMHSALFGA